MIPLFAEARISKPEKHGFFGLRIGYAPGRHRDYSRLENYEYRGGVMAEFYTGRTLPINEKLDAFFAAGLSYRKTVLKIDDGFWDDYKESVNYILIAIRAGVEF